VLSTQNEVCTSTLSNANSSFSKHPDAQNCILKRTNTPLHLVYDEGIPCDTEIAKSFCSKEMALCLLSLTVLIKATVKNTNETRTMNMIDESRGSK